MKKSIQVIVVFVFALMGLSTVISAQDEIIKNDGRKMSVWIKEVGDTQIKYIEVGDPNEIIFTIDRVLVKSVEFSYGKKLKKETGEYSDDYFADDKSQNLKINFLALAGGNILLSYEHALTPQTSIEGSLKFLGLGFFDSNDDNIIPGGRGLGLDVGYKMKLKSLFKKDGSYRPDQLLHGSYAKPMIGLHIIDQNQFFGDRVTSFRVINLGLDIGKQWIVNKSVSLDFHIGYHYYGGSKRSTSGRSDNVSSSGFRAGDLFAGDVSALSIGFRIGMLFGNYGDKKKGVRKKR